MATEEVKKRRECGIELLGLACLLNFVPSEALFLAKEKAQPGGRSIIQVMSVKSQQRFVDNTLRHRHKRHTARDVITLGRQVGLPPKPRVTRTHGMC